MALDVKTFVTYAEKEELLLPLFSLQIKIFLEVLLTFPGTQKLKNTKSKRKEGTTVFFSK
jgi:hypothetical protein